MKIGVNNSGKMEDLINGINHHSNFSTFHYSNNYCIEKLKEIEIMEKTTIPSFQYSSFPTL
jgi:hypothetical protein